MTTSDAIAFAALVVSIYTIISSEVKSRKSDREQKVIKDEQDRLRKLLLEKETKSAINEMKAELGARLVKIAKNNYRLKIFLTFTAQLYRNGVCPTADNNCRVHGWRGARKI